MSGASPRLSPALNVVVAAVRKAGRRLTIVPGSGPPRRLLETTGLAGRLDIVEEPPDSAAG